MRAGEVAQVVEHKLKVEVLSSYPVLPKQNKAKQNKKSFILILILYWFYWLYLLFGAL
jgi:hypothetical protein